MSTREVIGVSLYIDPVVAHRISHEQEKLVKERLTRCELRVTGHGEVERRSREEGVRVSLERAAS
jgi:hypothetical protein